MDLHSLPAQTGPLRQRIAVARQQASLPGESWYPYDSLSVVPLLAQLTAGHEPEVAQALRREAVLDLGCADGELSFLFEELGAEVDAIDLAESNFNQLRGIRALADRLASRVQVHNLDLDGRFQLPRARYSFTLFLGLLYHLKNPFYILEELAKHSAYCVLSTRVAAETPDGRCVLTGQPLVYLLDERETNNDPTNFWIFSPDALLRLCRRTGWRVLATQRLGAAERSNPVDADRDERLFLLLKSAVRFPELEVVPRRGFHAAEGAWCWTEKRFALDVWLPGSTPARQFALRLNVPEPVLPPGGQVEISCFAGADRLGGLVCQRPETVELRGTFPEPAQPGSHFLLEFEVTHHFTPSGQDSRELGVIIPFDEDPADGERRRIPFRIS